MNKRQLKKKNVLKKDTFLKEEIIAPTHLMEQIKKIIQSLFLKEEQGNATTIETSFQINIENEQVITLCVKGGRLNESFSTRNFYGNLFAKSVIEETKELSFVGFDCEYQVELEFKVKS